MEITDICSENLTFNQPKKRDNHIIKIMNINKIENKKKIARRMSTYIIHVKIN